MTTGTTGELRADVHSIEPIPEADKDSSGPGHGFLHHMIGRDKP
jgi:hypothetical protein